VKPHVRHTLWFDAQALGQRMPVTVLLPDRPAPEGGFPIVYLLHGGFSHHAEWADELPLSEWAARWDLAIVTPEAGSSMYVNGDDGRRFADYILEDVPGWAEGTLPVRRDRAGRALAGLSMGGFGSLNLGLSHAHRYAALGSLSGAFGMTWWNLGKRAGSPFLPALGPEGSAVRERNNPWRVLESVAANRPEELPRIGLWVGTEDDPDVVSANRAYHQSLESFGFPHRYRESPGGHDWAYWKSVTPELLGFIADALGLSPRD
jgi:putative tributyrin esterase